MRKVLKKIISRAYWLINNRVKHTFVESSCVSSKIRIGEYCWIRRGAEVNSNVEVGDYSYIGGPNTYVDEAVIGKFCSIARNVMIGPVNHNYNWVSTHPFICSKFYRFVESDKTDLKNHAPVIGNDVWIGMNCIILRGVKIGHGAVIGAGSVVSRDVAPYSIVTGIPARHMKYRYPKHIREALLEMKWWDWSKDRLKDSIPYMYDVQEFVERYREDTQRIATCECIDNKGMSVLKVMNYD